MHNDGFSNHESVADCAKGAAPVDASLSRELLPRLNAIVELAEVLKIKSGDNEGVQRILNVARDLLNTVGGQLPEPVNSGLETTVKTQYDVLYVEDNPISFGAVKLFLRSQRGLQVVQANCGEIGVAMAQNSRPKLILLDLNLPDIHGSEVLKQLQENPTTSHIPVVILSADATPSQIERLLVSGARNYLIKPFEIEPFLAVVDQVLEETSAAPS